MTALMAILLVGLQDPAALSESAKEKSKKGDYKGAEADLDRAIEFDPRNPQLYSDRGDARYSLRQWDKAVEDYSQAAELDPKNWIRHFALGVGRLAKGDYDGSIMVLTRAIELAPEEGVPYLNRANAKHRKGDNAGAQQDYAKVIELKPKSPLGYAARGQLREAIKDIDGALADFDKAIQLRTKDPQAYISRGRILVYDKKKSFGKAMDDLDMAVRLDPKLPFGYMFRGYARIELDECDGAIEDLTRALELMPEAGEVYHALAVARLKKGDRAGAVDDFARAIQHDPSSFEIVYARGCALFELGEWKKAVGDFRTAARLDGAQRDYPEFRIWICRAHLGEREAATADLQEYLKSRSPKGPDDWAGSVGAYLSGKIPEKDFRAAAKTEGQRCEAAFYVGSVRLAEGGREAAGACFEECLRTRQRTFSEYKSAAAAMEQMTPGPRRPPVVPGRMKIEVLHVAGACAALERDPVCKNAEHWRFWVDEVEYAERERFFAEVRRQGKMEVSELLEWSDRRTLLWAPAKAPFSRISEALSACARAGIGDFPQVAFRSDPDGGAVQRDLLVAIPEKKHDVGEEAIDVPLAWVKGAIQRRVGKSPWSADDAELLAEIQEAGATTGRSVLLDPAPDVPYGEALRIHRLCRSWNLQKADFKIPSYRDPGPRPWGAVTAEEAEKLARDLEEAAASGSAETFDRAVAWQEMLRRMIGDATLSVRAQCLVEETYRTMALSGKRLAKPAESSRPLKYLRMKTVDGAPCPLLRLLSKEIFDYVELELGKGSDGSVLILDIRRLTSDGSESQFLRRVCLPRKEDLELVNVLKAPMAIDIAASYHDRFQLTDLAIEKKYEEGLKFFADHRAPFRNDPSGHRTHLTIARSVGPEAYAKAVADLEEDLPNDSVLHLLRVERAIMTGKHDQALAAVDALKDLVGEDPYLLVIRANVEFSRGRSQAAKELAARATEKEPVLDRAWWTLFNSSVQDKDYPSAVSALNVLEKRLRAQIPDLPKTPGFEDFVRSSEYSEWVKSRP